MKLVEILLLIAFGILVSVIYVMFVLFLSEEMFGMIWLPIGLLIVIFLYILKTDKGEVK